MSFLNEQTKKSKHINWKSEAYYFSKRKRKFKYAQTNFVFQYLHKIKCSSSLTNRSKISKNSFTLYENVE